MSKTQRGIKAGTVVYARYSVHGLSRLSKREQAEKALPGGNPWIHLTLRCATLLEEGAEVRDGSVYGTDGGSLEIRVPDYLAPLVSEEEFSRFQTFVER